MGSSRVVPCTNRSFLIDYQFIDKLHMEHDYQHHVAEESQVHLRTRKKITIKLILNFLRSMKQLSDTQLAIR
jgi:hypothetical protein